MLVFDPGDADGGVPTTGPTKAALNNFSPNLVQLANGDVLAFGGTLSGAPTAVAQVYSASTNMWRNVGNMTQARGGAAGAFLLASGDVLIVGGDDASGAPLATAEVYHP
jgi:N-acetylneuraminic acid mutarotase